MSYCIIVINAFCLISLAFSMYCITRVRISPPVFSFFSHFCFEASELHLSSITTMCEENSSPWHRLHASCSKSTRRLLALCTHILYIEKSILVHHSTGKSLYTDSSWNNNYISKLLHLRSDRFLSPSPYPRNAPKPQYVYRIISHV